jgi:TonB family protein
MTDRGAVTSVIGVVATLAGLACAPVTTNAPRAAATDPPVVARMSDADAHPPPPFVVDWKHRRPDVWRFAGFFNRVKEQVAQHWRPEEVFRRHAAPGASYPGLARSIDLSVRLTRDGRVAEAAVTGSCGLAYLDEHAVTAFRAAQPFASPPRDLVEPDDSIPFIFRFELARR